MTSQKEKDEIWEKGHKIRGRDPNLYRKDNFRNVIYKPSYGLNSPMGWEIDHKKPFDKKGTDTKWNKRPLQTEANRRKSSKYPYKPKKK